VNVTGGTTGIPIDWLFAAIAAMLGIIYADIKYEVRRLKKYSEARATTLALIKNGFNNLCAHLGAPFHIHEDDQNG
jgi:hypothetical protein